MTNSQEESKPRVSIRSPEAQFAIGPAIDGVLDDLIQTGADIVSLLEYNRNKRGEIDLTRSQANNMVTVAARTRSREVVTNFIRYQMGRETGKSWRYVSVSNPDRLPFGREIINDIEGGTEHPSVIDENTEKVVKAVLERVAFTDPDKDLPELRAQVRARLTELYLGYMNRLFAYCDRSVKNKDEECWKDVRRVAERRGMPND